MSKPPSPDKSEVLNSFLNNIPKSKGKLIAFHYTLSRASNEEEIDSNIGGEPMVFQSGDGQMLPALEEEVVKLNAGETLSIVLPPEKAFGPVRDELLKEFPLTAIPEETRQVGRHVMVKTPQGEERMLVVVGIDGDKAIIDFNHDYAGIALKFDIEVVSNIDLDPQTQH